MAMTTQPPAPGAQKTEPPPPPALPLSQSESRRQNWPAWARQLPHFLRLPPARQDFSLVDRVELKRILEGTDPQVIVDIEKDLDVLERDLVPFFVKRDMEASAQQNRYRLYQIGYIFLAMLATVIGSFMVLALNQNLQWVPVLGFCETLVALLATFLSNIGTRGEPPLTAWIDNRRRAESLRREFFRYLVVLPPYDDAEGYKRRMLLAERAALINQGKFPDEKSTSGGSQS